MRNTTYMTNPAHPTRTRGADTYYARSIAYQNPTARPARIGDPCDAIKSDGFYCSRPATVVIDDKPYCNRHGKKQP